jgi:hypothetical protein
MSDSKLLKFRIRSGNSLSHNGEVKKAGDVVELSENQALEFRNMVEPADEEAGALFAGIEDAPDMVNLRDHERVQVLTKRRGILTGELEKIDVALKAIEGRTPQAARFATPPPPASEALPKDRTK